MDVAQYLVWSRRDSQTFVVLRSSESFNLRWNNEKTPGVMLQEPFLEKPDTQD